MKWTPSSGVLGSRELLRKRVSLLTGVLLNALDESETQIHKQLVAGSFVRRLERGEDLTPTMASAVLARHHLSGSGRV